MKKMAWSFLGLFLLLVLFGARSVAAEGVADGMAYYTNVLTNVIDLVFDDLGSTLIACVGLVGVYLFARVAWYYFGYFTH